MEARIILVTCGSEESAQSLSEALVGEKLAACVNLIPGLTSIYHWEGKICREAEWLLIIKSKQSLLPALEKRVHELHSYDTPEFVVLTPEHLNAKYASWLMGSI